MSRVFLQKYLVRLRKVRKLTFAESKPGLIGMIQGLLIFS